MKLHYTDFLVIMGIGLLLLIADRYIRIEPFTNQDPALCGVDRPPCPFGTRCMNGVCRSDNLPPLQKTTLPVFP